MMAGQSKKPRQEDVFLSALLSNPTIAMAAKAAGISEATATRWLKDEAFKARYAEARHQALGEAMAYLQASMLGAVATLRHVMLDTNSKPTTKVAAARSILELGLRSIEIEDMEHKMDEILRAMEALRHAQSTTP